MRVATAALLPNSPTFSSGTFTAGANAALVVDGVTLAVNDRVLVKDQGNTGSTRNGIYVVTTAGSVSVPWVITRATDADTSAEVLSGMRVRVTEGTVNAQTEWALATTGAITLDTTVLAFIQTAFAAAWLPVRVATTAVLPQSGTYGSKAFSALSNAALVIDGVTLAVGDRVLVKDQGDSTNGIFVVTNAGSAGSTWAMRRATDAFVSQQFLSGMSVRVSEGTVNAGAFFYLSTTGAITLDTTTLTFSGEFTAADFKTTGKTGATASPAILAGGTASGAPTTGAHVVGELVVDATGTIWICTAAGTPGTWVANGSGVELGFAAATADQTFTSGTIANVTSLSITFTVGSRPVYVHAHLEVGTIATSGKYLQWAVTDNAGTVKADSYASAGFAGATVQSDAWERIATPGTYTRKVMAGSSNTFSATVYGATYPGSFLRAITA